MGGGQFDTRGGMVASRAAYFDYLATLGTSYDELEAMSGAELERFQLDVANNLFRTLSPDVRALERVAKNVRFTSASCIDDLVPLLFPHTAYKSYSLDWLRNGDFQKLTQWLQAFTSIDVSQVDVSNIELIDDWIDVLDRGTDLRVANTFGTSGKLSFIPRSNLEWTRGRGMLFLLFRDFFGANKGPDFRPGDLPVIFPGYRFGASASGRAVDGLVVDIAGADDNTLFLYPNERFSADVAALAGLLKGQEGASAKVAVPARLIERQQEFRRQQEQRAAQLEAFLAQVSDSFRGRAVYIFLLWPTAIEWAETCLDRGVKNVFGPGTIFHTGGGTKGQIFTDGWRERVLEFLGVERYYEFYGMTEVYPPNIRCEAENYHISKMILPFLLDPKTGHALPRTGEQTGRYAALDLNATTMWGGFVTGDRVTMGGWDRHCACGRPGIYVKGDIARFSELQGGVDKISCAAAPEAHEKALQYLVEQLA